MSNATIAWGRFNPPTEEGHGKLVSAVRTHAEKTGGQHYIFPTHTQDKKKNPLTHTQKVSALRSLFPDANVVSHDKVRTIIDAMKHLESKGHTNVTVVAGSDRVDQYHEMLNKYRKDEFPGIKKVSVVSAGQRDPDAEGAEGMSASKLRGLVASGKRDEFISHYSDKKLGASIHDKVKAGMQMESVSPIGIFLLGGPGSGKDYVLKNIFSRFDLTEVQIDHILNGSAKELLDEQKNIVINGAIDESKIANVVELLEGYNLDTVYVSVTNKVSRLRNSLRENPLSENKRLEKWYRSEKMIESLEDKFVFNNSINLNESSEMERVFFADQIQKLLERLIAHGLAMKEQAEPQSFKLIRERKFPTVRKDKESGLPKKYVAGLSSSTAKARKAHWRKMSKYSDKDSRAYAPAPGDATAKTKPSKHTLAVRKMMDEETIVESKADSSLSAKAKKSGIPLSTLRKVYRRGVAAWNSGHRPGTTPSQWGHARVNSYINKGKTYHTADKDLREETKEQDINALFEMQLLGTDEYRKHAIAMTPGQNQEIEDVNKTLGIDASYEDCGCEDANNGDCDCIEEETNVAGNTRSFRDFRSTIKEAAKEVELPPTADVTPTLTKTKPNNKEKSAGRLLRATIDGLPVSTRLTGEEVEQVDEVVGTAIKAAARFGRKLIGKETPADKLIKDLQAGKGAEMPPGTGAALGRGARQAERRETLRRAGQTVADVTTTAAKTTAKAAVATGKAVATGAKTAARGAGTAVDVGLKTAGAAFVVPAAYNISKNVVAPAVAPEQTAGWSQTRDIPNWASPNFEKQVAAFEPEVTAVKKTFKDLKSRLSQTANNVMDRDRQETQVEELQPRAVKLTPAEKATATKTPLSKVGILKKGLGKTLGVLSAPEVYNTAKDIAADIGAGEIDVSGGGGTAPGIGSALYFTKSGQKLRDLMRKWGKTPNMPDPLNKALDKLIPEEVNKLEEAVMYHLTEGVSFTENAFRPGSEMFFNMIDVAKELYKEGHYTPTDEWEVDMLNSDIGEKVMFEGKEIILDYPFEETLEEEVEQLDEVFDTAYPHLYHGSIGKHESSDHAYTFHVPEKGKSRFHTYSVFISNEPKKGSKKVGNLSFQYNGKQPKNFSPIKGDDVEEVMRAVSGDVEVTGTGGGKSSGIISTVKTIAQKHAKEHGLTHMEFGANWLEPSRTKLYSRIATRMGGKELGMEDEDSPYIKYSVPLKEGSDPTEGKGIGKPWREGGGGAVYVRDGNSIRKIRFSQSGMKKRYMDPGATRSFVARHRCLSNKDKTSASYWACRWPRFFSNSGKVWW